MRFPRVRRRFIWPADDLVTLHPRFDRIIDRSLSPLLRERPRLRLSVDGGNVVVIGFPRSANTVLTMWMTHITRDHVTVIDGRYTHSALDVVRFAENGIPVVIPVRHPVDASASMLVRQGRHECPESARRMLRAYWAWHQTARTVLGMANVVVAPFDLVTSSPAPLVDHPALGHLIDSSRAAEADFAEIVVRTRAELTTIVGQGIPENGIPAHYLISVPEAARGQELARARALILAPELERERQAAESMHAAFMESDPSAEDSLWLQEDARVR